MASTRTVRNGSKHTIAVHEMPDNQRLLACQYALSAYQRRGELAQKKDERRFEMERIASSGLFSAAHMAKIFDVNRSMFTRLGIKPDTGQKKAGGAFNPACLQNIVLALRAKVLESRLDIQHIRLAYEGGMSSVVISRLIGVSSTQVMRLIERARQTNDRPVDPEATRTSGSRPAARSQAQGSRMAEVAAYFEQRAAERRERDRLAREAERAEQLKRSGHPDPDTSATPVEAGCGDSADGSAAAGAEAGSGSEPDTA